MTIMQRVQNHYDDALNLIKENNILVCCLQGSQNYRMDYAGSDVDTKLLVTPSFEDICLNKKSISTTHIRDNEEHIDIKDVRNYIEMFRKHNINFMEILFTNYYIVNPLYKEEWDMLRSNRELIAKANPYRAVKAMKGHAMEKLHALEHPYPSKLHLIEKYGYDSKQLHHLVRFEYFIDDFISGKSYQDCIIPGETERNYLMRIKKNNDWYSLEEARVIAAAVMERIETRCEDFCSSAENIQDPAADEVLNNFVTKVIEKSIKKELGVL